MAIVERVLSIEKPVELGEEVKMVVLEISLDHYGKLPLVFLEGKEKFEEGWQDLVFPGFGIVGEQLVVGVVVFPQGF